MITKTLKHFVVLFPGSADKCGELDIVVVRWPLAFLSVGSCAGREVAEGRSVAGERLR